MAEMKIVFISSTSIDLPEYREAVVLTLLRMGLFPSGMETWPVEDENPVDLCHQKVEKADFFVGIYAHRYGWRPGGPGTPSITEMEYDWATERGIPRFCFLIDEKYPWSPNDMELEAKADLDALKKRVRDKDVGFFTTPDDLKAQVVMALANHARSQVTGGEEHSVSIPKLPEELQDRGPISFEQTEDVPSSTEEEEKASQEKSITDTEPLSQEQVIPTQEALDHADDLSAESLTEKCQHGESPKRQFLDGILSVTQRPHTLLYFAEWEAVSKSYTQLAFQTDENRDEFVEKVRNLAESPATKGIRLVGKPGIGKTRLALETIRQLGLEDSAMYAATPKSLPPNLFSCLALAEDRPITLIVDNCTFQDVQAVWEGAQIAGNRVQFITIETFFKVSLPSKLYPTHILQPLAQDGRRNIVRQIYDLYGSYTFNDDKAAYPDETVGEDLKLLVAYITAFHEHPEIHGLAELSQTEELNHLLNGRVPTDHNELRTLQGLALSNRTGVYQNVKHDAHVIAEFMGLSYAEFKQSAESLRQNGLIMDTDWYRRDTYHRLVLPRLFAVHLARQVWVARGDDVLENLLLDQREELRSLRLGILERLADLGHQGIASPIIRYLLQQFETFNDLAQNADSFRLLGEADPLATITHLDRLMQDVSLDRLREFKDGRRHIVPLLSSLLRLEDTFWKAADLVGRFAAAENETFGNNATGTWQSIFFIRSGSNPINGLERLRLIRDFLDMSEPEMRIAAIKAIEGVLDNHEGGVVTRGPGGYITPPTWRPETWGEFWDIRRVAWQLLERPLLDANTEVANAATETALQYAFHQIPVLLDEVLGQLRNISKQTEYRMRVWKTLQKFMNFRRKDLNQDHFSSIQALADELITDRYHDQLEIYVADFDILERTSSEQLEETKQLVAQKLTELAKQGHDNEALLGAELDWLVSSDPWRQGSQVYSFIYELGRLDKEHRWFGELIRLMEDRRQLPYIEAYLRGRLAEGEAEWVRDQVMGWTETNELLAPVIIILPNVATEGDEIAAVLHLLLDRNWVTLLDIAERKLESFCTNTLSTDAMRSLLERMIGDESPEGTYVGTAYLFERLQDNPEEAPEYVDIAFQLMTGSAGEYSHFGLFDWYREELENLYLAEYPREVVRIILQKFKQSDGYIFDFMGERDAVRKILIRAMQLDSQIPLDILERTILPEDHPDHISEFRFTGLHINRYARAEDILNWAERHQPDGPRSLAEICFVGGVPLDETVRGLIIQYFQDDQVGFRLAYKFTQLGMMEVSQIPVQLRELRGVAREWLDDDHPQVRRWAQEVLAELESQLIRWKSRF